MEVFTVLKQSRHAVTSLSKHSTREGGGAVYSRIVRDLIASRSALLVSVQNINWRRSLRVMLHRDGLKTRGVKKRPHDRLASQFPQIGRKYGRHKKSPLPSSTRFGIFAFFLPPLLLSTLRSQFTRFLLIEDFAVIILGWFSRRGKITL